jgi:hypothetical protein
VSSEWDNLVKIKLILSNKIKKYWLKINQRLKKTNVFFLEGHTKTCKENIVSCYNTFPVYFNILLVIKNQLIKNK